MRWLMTAIVGLTSLAAPAQYGPSEHDPRYRRAQMEQAVAKYGGGEAVRKFIEDHGDVAVKAINACSLDVGKRLAEWHGDPDGLGKLPRPGDLLRVVADRRRGGDDVVLFSITHARDLRDLDTFEAFLRDPLEYSLSLKPLSQGAAENRAQRLAAADSPSWGSDPQSRTALLVIAGAAALVFVCWLLRRRRDSRYSQPNEA